MPIKSEYGQQLGSEHWLSIGASTEDSRYDANIDIKYLPCTDSDPDCPTVDALLLTFQEDVRIQTDIIYLEDQWALTEALRVTAGVHFTLDDYPNALPSL